MTKKKVLITAGPTWVKIDEVRIITNIFTGRTGLFLASGFARKGYEVVFLVNPHALYKIPSFLRVIPFKYFKELEEKLKQLLKNEQFHVIIHTAAVSDYILKRPRRKKIPSGLSSLVLELSPTKKLIKLIRRYDKEAFLIQFKLEITQAGLIKKAIKSLKENQSDLVVANAYEEINKGYHAYIIDKNKNITEVYSFKLLLNYLLKLAPL